MGGGILDTKNAFTLIELLAIIVILAIIAVITVPIILNIIENSKKGAAKDSAYGYKDAVNKWYVSELSKPNNQNFNLSSSYTVEDGKIIDDSVQNDTGVLIPFSGDKPSSGYLNYSNNTLTGGCLVFGDYAVTFDGNTASTVKGTCSPANAIASCTGCKFIYPQSSLTIGTSAMPSSATDDYTDWTSGANSHPYFLGLIADSKTGKIGNAFACGIETDEDGNDVPFCLEGHDTTKWSVDANVGVLNKIFPGCNADADDTGAACSGSSVSAGAYANGSVGVDDDDGGCYVGYNGNVYCE